jgi:multiple sugar transport system substrate-binding protein
MRRRSSPIPRLLAVLTTLSLVAGCAASPSPGASGAGASGGATGDAVEIRWFCCLGAGNAAEQVKVEKEVADEFNASHPGIHLTFDVSNFQDAYQVFGTQLNSPDPPDIVGPVGIGGGNAFPNVWLDLTDEIQANNYDLSQFPDNLVQIYQLPDEGQTGIPFAIYPSALFYRKSLFEEAGLNEPPHAYGDKYVMPDGSEVDWNYDTIRQIGKILTVDKNGNDATSASFDPKNIVQWGFEPQRDDLRQTGAYWGAGRLVADDGTTAQIPDAWAAAWHSFYDGMHVDHMTMTGQQFQSPDFNPSDYPFFTGNVAMSTNYLWSTYGIGDAGDDVDLAALPSYNGQVTAAFNADTFRILKKSDHPHEAFIAMSYLLNEAAPKLLNTYGGMPAREAERDAFFETLQGGFKQTIDWQVAVDGIQYADNPNFESPMPNYNEALNVLNTFGTRWQTTPGLDLDAEIEKLRGELQKTFDAAP